MPNSKKTQSKSATGGSKAQQSDAGKQSHKTTASKETGRPKDKG